LREPAPPFGQATPGTASAGRSERLVTAAAREGPPQSIADHIDDALKHVAGLTPKQRLAVHNEMTKLCRDISFIRMLAESARGPWSEAAVRSDEPR